MADPTPPNGKTPGPNPTLFALQLAGQIGYMIAIPGALLGFLGAYIDKYLGTSPLFVILGLLLAFSASSVSVYRLVKRVQEADDRANPYRKPPDPDKPSS